MDSLAALEVLKDEFFRRENVNENTKEEINGFLTEQTIDIFFQSMKYAGWLNRLVISFLMVFNMRVFLRPRGLRYIRAKFKMYGSDGEKS